VSDAPLELADIAAEHPVRHVTLDFSRLNVSELLTVLDRKGHKPLDVLVVIAWVIGRKRDPELTLETVRTSWRIEPSEGPVVDPTPAARPSSGRRTSSRSRG
jgi:hypothetical protein